MERYIDADFLIEQLQPAKNAEWNKRDYSKSKSEMIEDFCTELRNTRIADVVEVRHGEWDEVHIQHEGYGEIYYNHKECKISPDELYKCPFEYCPRCGAKMDGGKAND